MLSHIHIYTNTQVIHSRGTFRFIVLNVQTHIHTHRDKVIAIFAPPYNVVSAHNKTD